MTTEIISDDDMDRAISVYNELTVVPNGEKLSEIGRLIHNDCLFSAMILAIEAALADAIAEGYLKMPNDKIKWKARASKEYKEAITKAAFAAGELGAAKLKVTAAESVIRIWQTQNANNRKGHL